ADAAGADESAPDAPGQLGAGPACLLPARRAFVGRPSRRPAAAPQWPYRAPSQPFRRLSAASCPYPSAAWPLSGLSGLPGVLDVAVLGRWWVRRGPTASPHTAPPPQSFASGRRVSSQTSLANVRVTRVGKLHASSQLRLKRRYRRLRPASARSSSGNLPFRLTSPHPVATSCFRRLLVVSPAKSTGHAS